MSTEQKGRKREEAEDFFAQEQSLLAGYAQVTGLQIVPGNQWGFDLETGTIFYDPQFFIDKGFSRSQAMSATLHELEELREFRRSPSLYRKEFDRREILGFRYQILHNCLQDTLINRTLGNRAPVHRETIRNLYRQRLFPETDYTQHPRHLQFAHAILREAMLPEEKVRIDTQVRQEIEGLKDIKGKNLLELIAQPGVEPAIRLKAIRLFIEPIFEELFQEDLKERKKQGEKKQEKEGEEVEVRGEGEGEVEKSKGKLKLAPNEEGFRQEYEKEENRLPHPMAGELQEELIREFEDQVARGAGPEELDRRAYELEHGVSWEDIQGYYGEYITIKPYIEYLRKVFEKVISRRIEYKRRLRARRREGAVIDPGLLSQAKLDADVGISDSPVWLDYQKRPVEVVAPGGFEVTLVCDLSCSMEMPREKLVEERHCVILFLEALKDFHQLAETHREEMVELGVKSEVRGFGNFEIELKPLSSELKEITRIEVFKNLASAPGLATWDYESLEAIREDTDQEKQRRLAAGELKKAVIVFSDGISSNPDRVQEELVKLRQMGVTVVGVGITRHARAIENTYSPESKVCDKVNQLPEILAELLREFTKEL